MQEKLGSSKRLRETEFFGSGDVDLGSLRRFEPLAFRCLFHKPTVRLRQALRLRVVTESKICCGFVDFRHPFLNEYFRKSFVEIYSLPVFSFQTRRRRKSSLLSLTISSKVVRFAYFCMSFLSYEGYQVGTQFIQPEGCSGQNIAQCSKNYLPS